MTKQVSLDVAGQSIKLDYFVESFIDHTTRGMVSSLEGVGEINTLVLTISGEEVELTINESDIPVNRFSGLIIASTVAGMVAPLKGVAGTGDIRIGLG